MNFLNKSNVSTREVVEELEKTKHKLQKSQTRLINLSAAYKALQEEKKTLEATISAISSQGSNMSSTGIQINILLGNILQQYIIIY